MKIRILLFTLALATCGCASRSQRVPGPRAQPPVIRLAGAALAVTVSLPVGVQLVYDNAAPFQGSIRIVDGSRTVLADIPFDATGTATANLVVDPAANYTVYVLDPTSAQVFSAPALLSLFDLSQVGLACFKGTVRTSDNKLIPRYWTDVYPLDGAPLSCPF